MDWLEQQVEVRRWREKNFPPEKTTLIHQSVGAMGEVAELQQHALKMDDARNDGENHYDAAVDAVGDTLIYLMGAADHLGMTMEQCFMFAWDQVKGRTADNWRPTAQLPAEGQPQ